MSQLLETKQLKKSFGHGSNKIEVLHGISVTFKQSNTYAITGISGSGKSTFMHLLAGLDSPTHGTVAFNHKNLQTLSITEKEDFLNRSIGLVFQQPYLMYELSVLENVMLKGLIAGDNSTQAKERARNLLARVGLEHKAHQHPASLSGGQQQRISLVRALFNKPAFLLADEPTGSLDHETGKLIVDLLLQVQKEWSMGLIISSHDPYVAQMMKTVLHMQDGLLTENK
jgi:lipoprotein-releasing system ATP-binding protein